MPAIRSQSINADGFTLETISGGVLEVVISFAGNTHTITCKKDGVVQQAPTVNNATASVLESLINNWMNGNVPGTGTQSQQMYNACHIFSLSPLSLTTITSVTPISGEWWAIHG